MNVKTKMIFLSVAGIAITGLTIVSAVVYQKEKLKGNISEELHLQAEKELYSPQFLGRNISLSAFH